MVSARSTTRAVLASASSLFLFASVGMVPVVQAQSTNATCLTPYAWMYNSKGQSPCLVAAYLAGVCNGGQFDVPSLDANEHYIGPGAAQVNDCQCSSVFFSLMSACGTCQNGTIISWSSWTISCSTVSVATWPEQIPVGTTVPAWAYIDVSKTDMFSASLAQSEATLPESTATQVQSTAKSTGTSSGSKPSGSTNPTGNTSKSSSNAGAIAGGVVGGIIAILVIGGGIFYFTKKRTIHPTASPNHGYGSPVPGQYGAGGYGSGPDMSQNQNGYYTTPSPFSGSATVSSHQPLMTPGSGPDPRLYNPNDPSTFPTSPTPASTTSPYNPGMPAQTYPYSPAPNTGVYSGIAEI